MSVVRVSSQSGFSSGMSKESWTTTLLGCLDGLERHAGRIGAELDWDSIEFETDATFIETGSLMDEESELRITTLHVKALGVMK